MKGHAARWFAIASTVLLLNEALLGALLVKLGYVTGNQSAGRMVLLSIHLSNTLLLVAALTLTARFLATGLRWARLDRAPGFGWAVAGLAATIGVGVSGSMAALGDTLFPAASLQAAYVQDFGAGAPWLLRLRLVHPVSALLAALFVIWLVRRSRQPGPVTPSPNRSRCRTFLARLVVLLLVLQFALGIADVLLLAPAWMQLVHLLGADLYWVALVLLAAETVWPDAAIASVRHLGRSTGAGIHDTLDLTGCLQPRTTQPVPPKPACRRPCPQPSRPLRRALSRDLGPCCPSLQPSSVLCVFTAVLVPPPSCSSCAVAWPAIDSRSLGVVSSVFHILTAALCARRSATSKPEAKPHRKQNPASSQSSSSPMPSALFHAGSYRVDSPSSAARCTSVANPLCRVEWQLCDEVGIFLYVRKNDLPTPQPGRNTHALAGRMEA